MIRITVAHKATHNIKARLTTNTRFNRSNVSDDCTTFCQHVIHSTPKQLSIKDCISRVRIRQIDNYTVIFTITISQIFHNILAMKLDTIIIIIN